MKTFPYTFSTTGVHQKKADGLWSLWFRGLPAWWAASSLSSIALSLVESGVGGCLPAFWLPSLLALCSVKSENLTTSPWPPVKHYLPVPFSYCPQSQERAKTKTWPIESNSSPFRSLLPCIPHEMGIMGDAKFPPVVLLALSYQL